MKRTRKQRSWAKAHPERRARTGPIATTPTTISATAPMATATSTIDRRVAELRRGVSRRPPRGNGRGLAERVGFEPTDLSVNGFQDRRNRPLCHLSGSAEDRGPRPCSQDVARRSGPRTDDLAPEIGSEHLRHLNRAVGPLERLEQRG